MSEKSYPQTSIQALEHLKRPPPKKINKNKNKKKNHETNSPKSHKIPHSSTHE
jgi:hypothetical protein